MTSKANGSSWISGQNPAERVLPVFQETTNCKKQFAEKVQFMLVGIEGKGADDNKEIRPLYTRYREKEKLTLPCAF